MNNVLSLIMSGQKAQIKRYEPVTAIWPYAVRSPTADAGDDGLSSKIYAVRSEDSWIQDWK